MHSKRKRPDRPFADGGRPSPHRPGDMALGQYDRGDGGGRGRGGGYGGGPPRHDYSQSYGRGGPSTSRRVASSSQSQPPSAPSVPVAVNSQTHTPPPRPPSPVRSNYHYDNLTGDKLRTWSEKGRQQILDHGIQSREDVDITELSVLFQEFTHAVVEAKLDPTEAGSCIKEILGDETSEIIKDSYAFAPHTLLIDSIVTIIDNDPTLYRPMLRDFLIATDVSPNLMREVMSEKMLEQLGLVREKFSNIGIKQATNLLYRQANYNLLREETEGYSKLIADLYTTSSSLIPPHPQVAEQTFERIKALIGTFDLDVGRVLDVTLDVAASVVVKQVKFFVRLFRVSSWWPRAQIKAGYSIYPDGVPNWARPGYPEWITNNADEAINRQRKLERDVLFWDRAREIHLAAFFELTGRHITPEEALNVKDSGQTSGELTRQWMKETQTLPASGNRVAAQLLGFKLRFYYSEYRGENDVLPANLLYLVAVLCKIGFISLLDIYPHLSPSDDCMEQVREEQLKVLEEEDLASRAGPMNALARAGVLPDGDDDATSFKHVEPAKKVEASTASAEKHEDKRKKPIEQKVSLLIQLLTIGAVPEALFILGRFSWIPETYPEVLQRIHRLLHVCLEKVYQQSQPKARKSTMCPAKEVPDHDQTGLPKGSVRLSQPPIKKVNPWPYPDAVNTKDNSSNSWRYFWDEWADNVPVCQTTDDVFTLCNTFLNISGVNIGKDEALLAKLASIGVKSLDEDSSDKNRSRWLDLLKRLLVPALSHTRANASVVNAIWNLLRQYPTITRYTIYAEWFEGQMSRLPAMGAAFARAKTETRGTMKRISLTNLSEMAKKMAKTSFSSPGVVFKVALDQLESYPNLIEAFVECAKYFPDLSYDVLVWSLLSSLGKSRSRTQADHALTTSKWLQALSRFSGKIFRRYSILDPTPVLYYVNDQLFKGNSTDLIILKELVSSMGGIVDATDFTDYQVLSMAGGECLRRHTLIRGQDKRFENIKSSRRLIQALKDSNLAARLLINLAQYRQTALFQVAEDEAHIKFLSALVDESHQTLLQYLDFLWTNLEHSAFDTLVPSITELMTTYGIDVSLAFAVGRPSLVHRMFPWKAKKSEEDDKASLQAPHPEPDKDGDLSMLDMKEPNGVVTSTVSEATATDEQVGVHQPLAAGLSTNSDRLQRLDEPSQISSALQPVVQSVQGTLPDEVWQKIRPELFVTFWALQLGDLFCPDKIYKQERERLKTEELAIARDRSDMTRKGQERKMDKRRDLMQLQIDLSEECGEHLLRQAKWKFNLSKQFQVSFPDPSANVDSVSDTLMERCFLPRVLLSTADAEYTFRFIKALHDWNAPLFNLRSLYDRLFNANRLRSLIFTCTVREAEYFGRFLRLVLEDLSRWHKNEPVPIEKDSKMTKDQPRLGAYEKEAKGPIDQPRLGFALKFDESGKPITFLEHAQFKDLLFRWHKNMNTALKSCLGGTEWMQIRNAITILRSVLDFFPAVDFMANQFSAQLQKITKQESASRTTPEGEQGHRVDLSVAAQGAMSELQKRKSKWVMVQAFRPNTVREAQADAEKFSPPSLRATAPEFNPQSSRSDGRATALNEEEDGEVQDGKDGKNGEAQTPEAVQQSGSGTHKDSLPAKPSGPAKLDDQGGTGDSTPGRSSTSRTGHAPKPNGPRVESPRPNTLPSRPPPATLPSKPDVSVTGHFNSERFPPPRGHDRRDNRDARDMRGTRDPRDVYPRDGRESRDGREPKDPRETRLSEPEMPERPREQERRPEEPNRAEFTARPGPGERDRAQRDPRVARPQNRPEEGVSQTPGAHLGPEATLMNPDRAAFFGQDEAGQTRAPELDRSGHGRRQGYEASDFGKTDMADAYDDTPSRGSREGGRDRAVRGHSPRRSGRYNQEAGSFEMGGRDEWHPRGHASDTPSGGKEPGERAPVGNFRGDRFMDRNGNRGTGDNRHGDPSGYHGTARAQEPEYNRGYQDQNYGRLNPIPSALDVPSGPRSRGRGATRGGHEPSRAGPARDGRLSGPDTPRGTSPERQPPTGPSSVRGRRGGFESGGGAATFTGSGGVPHADRSKYPSSGQELQPAFRESSSGAGVHPDRLAQMGGPSTPSPAPPQQGSGRQSTSDQAERAGTDYYGPRQASGGSGAPTNEGVPTGPAASQERGARGGGGRRQLAGINSTLQQAQANMPDVNRSSGGVRRNQQPRQMLGAHSDAQVLTGGSPASTPSYERQEPMWSEMWGRGPSANGQSAFGEPRARREPEGRADRSNRSSRRNSRERERERSPGREREAVAGEHRAYDRRSVAGTESGAREEREGRRAPGREAMAPPAGGRELMTGAGRDSRHRGGPAATREAEWAGGSRNGSRGVPRDGDPWPEEWREARDERGRKRMSEDGSGGLGNEREKRQRR